MAFQALLPNSEYKWYKIDFNWDLLALQINAITVQALQLKLKENSNIHEIKIVSMSLKDLDKLDLMVPGIIFVDLKLISLFGTI